MSDAVDTPELTLHTADEPDEDVRSESTAGADAESNSEPDPVAAREETPHQGPQAADPEEGSSDPPPERVVEAVLFATDSPLKAAKIAQIAGLGGVREVKRHIDALNASYEQQGSAFCIDKIAEGYQMLTRVEYNPWLSKLLRVRQDTRLSQAAMETLAIIAYKQPVLRADIEAIRGVACGEVLHRLREVNLIKIVGRAEDVGRPMLYGTTKSFLEVFGLGSLDDLPEIENLKPPE